MAEHVIFVDDERRFIGALRRYFDKVEPGWQLDYHTDPKIALEQLTNIDNAVLILDWTMPQMDGITACHKARKLAKANDARLHIIMLTGNAGPEYTVSALEGGADDYLSKPVSMTDLRTHIELGLKILSKKSDN